MNTVHGNPNQRECIFVSSPEVEILVANLMHLWIRVPCGINRTIAV